MSVLTILLLGLAQPAAPQPLSMSAMFGKEAPTACNPAAIKSIGCNAQAAVRRSDVAAKEAGPQFRFPSGRACRHQQAVAMNERGQ